MANELSLTGLATGLNTYALIRNQAGSVWNTGLVAWEAQNAANLSAYAITLSENGTTGCYFGNFPAVAAGAYTVEYRIRAGGSVAWTDAAFSDFVSWDGTKILGLNHVSAPDAATVAAAVRDVTGLASAPSGSIGRTLYDGVGSTPFDSGTARAGTTSTLQLRAGAPTIPAGAVVEFTGGLGVGQLATAASYNSGTQTVAFNNPVTVAGNNTTTYRVWVYADVYPLSRVAGYVTGQSPADLVLVTPANKLATNASGKVSPADGSIASATFTIGTPSGSGGFLERLWLTVLRFFPNAGGSVEAPTSGVGNLVVKTTGGAVLSTQAMTDNGTTKTLGPSA